MRIPTLPAHDNHIPQSNPPTLVDLNEAFPPLGNAQEGSASGVALRVRSRLR